MCIRDRDRIVTELVRAAAAGDAALLRNPRAVRPWQHVLEPVSYTHLRAHEPVLDLVCRLLLEKKNTHILQCDLPALL